MNTDDQESNSKFWEWLRDKARKESELDKETSRQLPLYIYIEKPQKEAPRRDPNEQPFDSLLDYEIDYCIDYYT